MILSDLTTKGFCVIKNFLNHDIINLIRSDFELVKGFAVNKDYPVLPAGKFVPVIDAINDIVNPISKSILTTTGLITNFTPTPIYFSTAHGVNFGWHQDRESYFLESHHDYLNIYVPIYKEKLELSNVCVVDFQKLVDIDPRTANLKRAGGTRFVVEDNKTNIHYDNSNSGYQIDFDINDIAECPYLGVGDALIMRGDAIHRTQDNFTERVSISIRRLDAATITRSDNGSTSDSYKFLVINTADITAINKQG